MYDLDTEEGMASAIAWTNHTLASLKDDGIWIVPRSGMLIRVLSHRDKVLRVIEGETPDPSIPRVLKAAGWTLTK